MSVSPTSPETRKFSLESLARELQIEMTQLETLYALFIKNTRKAKKGSNVALMLNAIRTVRETHPNFFTLNMNRVSIFVSALRERGLIEPRVYPKKRKGASVEGRRRLSAESVVALLSGRIDEFRESVRVSGSLERGYTSFAHRYNSIDSEKYFPVDWDILKESIRSQIKELLGIDRATMKVTDIPHIRFATKEEILAHPYFRRYFSLSLVKMKKKGISFHEAVPLILKDWRVQYSSTGLRLPVSLSKGSSVTTFQKVLGLSDVKIKSLLAALELDTDMWDTMSLPKEMQGPLPVLPNASIFAQR